MFYNKIPFFVLLLKIFTFNSVCYAMFQTRLQVETTELKYPNSNLSEF